MHLLADSGSTKTTWRLGRTTYFSTQGLNPFMLSSEAIVAVLCGELLPQLAAAGCAPTAVHRLTFYGAGCRTTGIDTMQRALQTVFPEASVTVGSDLLGAARALFPGAADEGVACILGTGSNSGLYRRGTIVANVSPLGYVLGDEGSGASLGKRLVADVLKRQLPPSLCRAFHAAYPDATPDAIIERTYRTPFPNRYLASFAPFLSLHATHPAISALLLAEFRSFFRRNVHLYARPDLPVSFVGSIAHHFEKILRQAAAEEGYNVGRILKEPLREE